MSLPLDERAGFAPTVKFGLNNEIYVICKAKAPLSNICINMGKAASSIYWNKKDERFEFCVKSAKHKHKLAIV